jgi:hypothetical protein
MLDIYFNQTITWKSVTSVNEYNEPTTTSTSIPARFEYKRKRVRNKEGVEVISEAQCLTASLVQEGDLITYDGIDWPVISVQDNVDLSGNVLFYEVML